MTFSGEAGARGKRPSIYSDPSRKTKGNEVRVAESKLEPIPAQERGLAPSGKHFSPRQSPCRYVADLGGY